MISSASIFSRASQETGTGPPSNCAANEGGPLGLSTFREAGTGPLSNCAR